MKKVKCKKQYGKWFYEIIKPTFDNNLRFPIYILQKEDKTDGGEFGNYNDMKHYIETGINLS